MPTDIAFYIITSTPRHPKMPGGESGDPSSVGATRRDTAPWWLTRIFERRSSVSIHVGPTARRDRLQVSAAGRQSADDGRGNVLSDHAGPSPALRPSLSLSKVFPAWSSFSGSLAGWRKGLPAFVTSVLLLASSSGGAILHAQSASGPKPSARPITDPLLAGFLRWDTDSDGTLTCQEWKRYAEQLFIRSDKNHDGVLAIDEFAILGKYEPIFLQADLAYFDDNLDGRVTVREFSDKPNPIFARYDRNRDCQLTVEEIRGGTSGGSAPASPPSGQQKAPPDGAGARR